MQTNPDRQSGFTLLEVLVIVPSMLLVITGLVAFLINLLNLNVVGQVSLEEQYDITNAQDIIESDLNITKTYLVAPDNTDQYGHMSDPYGPDNAGSPWVPTTNANAQNMLLLRMYATTKNIHDSTKQPVYINVYGCTSNVLASNPVLLVNVIYFVRNNTLYRRVLTDTSRPTCSPPYQVQTCPPDATLPLNSVCQGVDMVVATNVNIFLVAFWQMPGMTQMALPTTQNVLDTAVGVNAYTGVSRMVGNQAISNFSNVYVNKRNI